MASLSETDILSLKFLQNEARTSFPAIARELGVAESTIRYRMEKLREASVIRAFMVLLSVALPFIGIMTPLDEAVIVEAFEGSPGEACHAVVDAYPMTVKRYAIINSIVAVPVLGALYSFFENRRRKYNLLIFAGGVMPMIGGSALAFFHEPSLFFIFELGGTVFLYLGFIYSDKFIKAREAKIASARAEKRLG